MNVITQVMESEYTIIIVIVGLFFIICAIVVGVFKQYWLISGLNTLSRPKKELKAMLEKMDLEYVTKYFGIFTGIFGVIFSLSPFVFTYLNIMEYYVFFLIFAPMIYVGFMLWYGNNRHDKIYKN